jgi:hypothetical protein
MFPTHTLRQKGLNLLLLAVSAMLLVGLAACSNEDPAAPEVNVADVADVVGLQAALPTWQGFTPVLNNGAEAFGETGRAVRTYSNGANPMVNGHGKWETDIGTVGFQVSVGELPDGTINGHGVSTMHTENGNGWFHFDVVDAAPFGDEIAVLGLITKAVNTPPQFLGSLTVLIVRDNKGNGSDMALSATGLPSWLTLDNILYGPTPPPPFRFPLTLGNYKIQ